MIFISSSWIITLDMTLYALQHELRDRHTVRHDNGDDIRQGVSSWESVSSVYFAIQHKTKTTYDYWGGRKSKTTSQSFV